MSKPDKIAVIGMECRYPGAENINEYWKNLLEGKETISRFSNDELAAYEVDFDRLKEDQNFVPARGVINNVEDFDAKFFGYSPHEAKFTDPQHRVWLETVWAALENAGLDPYFYSGSIGVFAGGYINTYLINNILRDKQRLENFIRLRSTESFQIMTGNDISYLPTRTAYNFNLKGPAINVQTACSTSLVAIVQACRSLAIKESDICIAGGVCILNPQKSGYVYQEGAIPSPDGHCRPFDAEGKGTVFSNGAGVVILKRLEDATRDKDNIIAVVDGWALNNDGNKKVSYTAPSVEGQKEVILAAQKYAGINAGEIGYIEAHGTATQLGDPIEIKALSEAFSVTTQNKQYCGIGSVKSNIGHTDAAAGVASFIKVCLAAKHKTIPPTLHFKAPNPFIRFDDSPFFIVDKLKQWDSDQKLIMGVSSFGIGGTNAHVIVEEPPKISEGNSDESIKPYILPLSAKSKEALKQRKDQLIDFLSNQQEASLNDVAYTLWYGRNHMKYRSSIVMSGLDQLNDDAVQFFDGECDEMTGSIAFAFPGQGAQYIGMGKALYNENEGFKRLMDKGFSVYKEETGEDLMSIIFSDETNTDYQAKIAETAITQPALFLIEYCLARVLINSGVRPEYLIGHSIGEYAAACIAGVFDFITAMKIVVKRGSLMQQMKIGRMMAVKSTVETLRSIKGSVFEIAAQNSPTSCTISYDIENESNVISLLEKNEIGFIPLNTSHGFHSQAFEPMLEEFATFVDQFEKDSPRMKIVSCLTGRFLTAEQACNGKYWASQLRNTVQFYEGVKSILNEEQVLFLEVGPNCHLGSILKSIPEVENKKTILSTLGRPEKVSGKFIIEKILSMLWTSYAGYVPELNFISPDARKIVLPSYPFQRERFWVDYQNSDEIVESIAHHRDIESKPSSTGAGENDTVTKITEIWREILGIEDLSLSDNFFYVGGTSLIAISVVDKAKKIFNIDLSLKIFFDAPTIGEFSAYINESISKKDWAGNKEKMKNVVMISGEI